MSTPRVPPVPPRKGNEPEKSSPHRQVEKKVEKVDEVDDETRARHFRKFVEEEPEKPSELPTPFTLFSRASADSNGASSSLASTPEETYFSSSSPSSMDDVADTIVPSPSYSPPPATFLDNTVLEDIGRDIPLPQSKNFWQELDDPSDDFPLPQSQMQESSNSASRSFSSRDIKDEQRGENKERIEKKQPTPTEGSAALPLDNKKKDKHPRSSVKIFGKSLQNEKTEKSASEKTPEESRPPHEKTRKPSKPSFQQTVSPSEDQGTTYIEPAPLEKKQGQRPSIELPVKGVPIPPETLSKTAGRPPKKEETKEGFVAPSFLESNKKIQFTEEGKPPIKSVKEIQTSQDKEKNGELEKKKGAIKEAPENQFELPTLSPLPTSVIPMASVAATAAAPYLGPETLSMYFHMIGTIISMTAPNGDSQTEFILNSPTFANSKFYGASITIERFATAPYQFNIRLSGSNEAVMLFNQNIPNLQAAFQNGKFAFTVNRIDAVYKPLFHRKERTGDKGEQDSSGSFENRKK